MTRSTKIAISLPKNTLNDIEQQILDTGESRSEFFRRAAELLIHHRKELEMNEQYIQAYKNNPETIEEINAAKKSASIILSEEPWA